MSYSKKVQKAKANRSDHRKARAVAGSINRTALKRDSKKFKSLEREHDQNQRFGGSLKAVYFDSDGDGFKDTYGRVYRSGVVGKPGAEIPTFGPIVPPVSGPTNLLAAEVLPAPVSGPSSLAASIVAPSNGPTSLDASVNAPANGPTGLNAELLPPANGPTGLNAFEGIPDAPVSGPTTLAASVNAPANGPTGLNAAEVFTAPSSGPTTLAASVNAPANGPTGLGASVNAPANGPTGLSAAKATLNIDIYDTQEDLLSTATEESGHIAYAKDVPYLFIYKSDTAEWHRVPKGE